MNVEKVSNELLPSLAYGFDEYGDHVMQALQYLSERFGSVTSFTGTYEADRFSLSVQEQDTSGIKTVSVVVQKLELHNTI